MPLIVLVWVVRRWLQIVLADASVGGGFFNGLLKLPDVAVPRKQTIEFGINYCLDGLPPKSLL